MLEKTKPLLKKSYVFFSAGFVYYMNITLAFLSLLSNSDDHFSALHYIASEDKGQSALEGIS